MCRCGAGAFLVSNLILLVASFNLDTYNFVQHKEPQGSMFGFSIATHKEYGSSWVLVGAPMAQGRQSEIRQGGVLFKCGITADNDCQEIYFNQGRSGRWPHDDKTHQWFGATVSSAGPDGPVVACAPRYSWASTSTTEERKDPVGTCYITRDNFQRFSEYSPCRTSFYGYHRQGSCQAGFSAGISKDGRRLFIGAPGSWYWQGQAYSVDPSIDYPYFPGIFGEAFGFNAKGQAIQQSLDDRPAVAATPQASADEDNSYMGYSMVVGDFNNTGVEGVAVGMPRAGMALEGKVLLYTWNLINYHNISGDQMGSYFGYAIAQADINGDGRSDLIIGAPMYTDSKRKMDYEVGRVSIAYQSANGYFKRKIDLDGFNSKSRFGLSLAGLGDLNQDSFEDFAVGAPYDGRYERGAVYIFQGSAKGVIKKYSQVIYAEDVVGAFNYPVNTFGFSLTGGLDLDGNNYPDVAIGAYASNAAYFFRARPVVRVEMKTKFNSSMVYLDNKDCAKPGNPNVKVVCVAFQVCLSYSGVGVPSVIELDLLFNLDSKRSHSRMYLAHSNEKYVNMTATLYSQHYTCPEHLNQLVYVKDSITDKLTDLEIQVKYSLRGRPLVLPRNPTSTLVPIVDLSKPAEVNASVSIFRNCGPSNVCIPDLHLTVHKEVTKYLHGTDKPLEFDVNITNTADDAYDTKFFVHLPPGIEFRGAPIIDNTKLDNKLACSDVFNRSIFACHIGNPFVKNSGIHFKLRVAPIEKEKLQQPTYIFKMNATSVNPEKGGTMKDNSVEISVDIWVEATLAIEGKSTPPNAYYNYQNLKEFKETSEAKWDTEIGPGVHHVYTITNKGPSDVEQVEFFIIWPEKTLGGEDLLYLLEVQEMPRSVRCEGFIPNYQNLLLTLPRLEEGKNGTSAPLVSNVPLPPILGNTIIRTLSYVAIHKHGREVERLEIIGEPGAEEYWRDISLQATRFKEKGPYQVQANCSSVTMVYEKGRVVNRTIKHRDARPEELPFTEYEIRYNVSTVARYISYGGKFLLEEVIYERPNTKEFKDHIEKTKKGLKEPANLQWNSTWDFNFYGKEDTFLGHYTLVQSSPTTFEAIVSVVRFYDDNGVVISEEEKGLPNSPDFWTSISKTISRQPQIVRVTIDTYKKITISITGKKPATEKIPHTYPSLVTPLVVHTESRATIEISRYTNEEVLLPERQIPAPIGSQRYNEYINDLQTGYHEPVWVTIKHIHTVLYTTKEGSEVHREDIIDSQKEVYNPPTVPSGASVITTIIIYDANKTVLHQENITDVIKSKEYWRRIDEVIKKFYKQQITVELTTRSRENNQDVTVFTGSFKPEVIISSNILVYDTKRGTLLHNETRAEVVKSSKEFESMFPTNYLTIVITTTYTIYYRDVNNQIIHTETLTETSSKSYNPSVTGPVIPGQTVTTVIVYDGDVHRNVLIQRDITAKYQTEEFWSQISEIVKEYYNQPVTVELITRKDGAVATSGSYRPEITTSTKILVQTNEGAVLLSETVSGVKDSAEDIARNYPQQYIAVELTVTYEIKYRDYNNRVVAQATVIRRYIENFHPKHPGPDPGPAPGATLVIIYEGSTVVHQEKITEAYNSKAFWERVNKLITGYSHTRVNVKIITERETVTYNPQMSILSTVTILRSNGEVLYNNSIAGEVTSVNDIVASFQEPTRVVISTVYTIKYYDSTGYLVARGTVTVERRENHVPKPPPQQTQKRTISTIIFYDLSGRELYREEIHEEPNSPLYWENINKVISRFYQQNKKITCKVKRVIQYYRDGVLINTEEVHLPARETSFDTETTVTTTVRVFDMHGVQIHNITISGEKGSYEYQKYINSLLDSYRQPLTVEIRTVYVIRYKQAGRIIYTGQDVFEDRQPVRPTDTKETTTITTITIYGAQGNFLFQERISEEPKSAQYWQVIKKFLTDYSITETTTIHTNSSKIVTHYVDGQKTRTETIAGTYLAPFSCVFETVNIIVFYDSYHKELSRIVRHGELTPEAFKVEFGREKPAAKTMEVEISKTFFCRTNDGKVLHTEPIARAEKITMYTETNIKVYDSQERIVYEKAIEGDLESPAYRTALHEIMAIVRGPYRILTNVSEKITFERNNKLDRHTILNVHSTVQNRGGNNVITTLYGPNGQILHQDTIGGGRGQQDFLNRLSEITRQYSAVVRNYDLSQDETIGGSVTYVDGDYPGSKPANRFQHYDDFSRAGYNQSHEVSTHNDYGLSSFGRGSGFRTGVLDMGLSRRRNVDQDLYDEASSRFKSLVGDHDHHIRHKRKKREDTDGDAEIETLKQCGTSKCIAIRCESGPMRKGHEVQITLRARVVVQTVKKISMTQNVNIQSMLLARITQFQQISGPPAKPTTYRQAIATPVLPPKADVKPTLVPLWAVILSAVAGTLILLLLIFLLYKCGFFKRNRPSDAPERQPLNRNGHFQHGDEAL